MACNALTPIAWLPKPVHLLEEPVPTRYSPTTRGPLVIGVANDAVYGARRFQEWTRQAEKEKP